MLVCVIYSISSEDGKEEGGEMGKQIHTRFSNDQVKRLLDMYLDGTIGLESSASAVGMLKKKVLRDSKGLSYSS